MSLLVSPELLHSNLQVINIPPPLTRLTRSPEQEMDADPLNEIDPDPENWTPETKDTMERMTRLTSPEQLSNYLSFGKWDLGMSDIERLQKDDQMRQRVSTFKH